MRFYLLFIFFLLPFSAYAEDFSQSPAWLKLVHYQGHSGKYTSSIDSESFFLSPQGKTNPGAELQATISLLEAGKDKEKICLFPARYKLLKKQGLVSAEYPKCGELEQFYEDLRPQGVTLLFTDAYMNNPSSLFGHTLVRIDTARKGTQLLAHGMNYGAFTAGQENSVLFAVYGLTGGYYGGFTVKPYYDIINTYNNIENRDIWELNLDFTPEELDFFVAHLWEIGHTQTRYYFFTKNCSYMLMEMFDAVRPELDLAQKFPVQAIPLDTVKAVYRTPGLVKNVNYRPSRQRKIEHRRNHMNKEQNQALLDMVKKNDWRISYLEEGEKPDALETAYQFVQYQYVAGKLDLENYRRQSFNALRARQKIFEKTKIGDEFEGKSPLLSHEAMRATIGAGYRNGKGFQELSYRPAYHSLTDNNYGLLKGAEINFLNTTLRHYDEGNKWVLQRLDLVGIKSLAPVDELFKPFSYTIWGGFERVFNPQTQQEGYVAGLKVGGGGVYAFSDNLWGFAHINNYAGYGGFMPRNGYLGIGGEAGVFAEVKDWRLLASVEKVYATSRMMDNLRYKAETTYSLSTNNAVALEYSYQQNHGKNLEESILSWRWYF